MSAKPTDIPTFATSATGIARTTDPGAPFRADGYAPGDRVAANHLDWLLNRIGAWCQHLSDGALEGAFTFEDTDFVTISGGSVTADVGIAGALVTTDEADIRHGARTVVRPAAEGTYSGTRSYSYIAFPATTAGEFVMGIPLAVGDRLQAVRVICSAASGGASDLVASLYQDVIQETDAHGDFTATVIDTYNSTAVATVQALALTAGPATQDSDSVWNLSVAIANSAGLKYIYRVEVDYDRVA